jgi:gas vesicle protein
MSLENYPWRKLVPYRHDDDSNAILYVLAGVGLGAIIGAAAGLLFAPKSGTDLRGDIHDKVDALKSKTEEWIAEQKAKRAIDASTDELGA